MRLQDPETPRIRILLVDDHELFLAGLRSILRGEPELVVIGEAHNGNEALEAARGQPDIVLLDLDLGEENGLDLLPDLLDAAAGGHVLALTGLADPDIHVQAVCRGALGVVHKMAAPNLLVKAIRKVHAGEVWMNPAMVAAAMSQLQARQRRKADPDAEHIASLTSRELEVIALIGEGRRNKDIGDRLFISEKTVRHYLTSIFSKLGVKDRLELMIYAYQHGLAKVPVQHGVPTAARAAAPPPPQFPPRSAGRR
jgi:DNA-binding NarL/FixJ family response regulator